MKINRYDQSEDPSLRAWSAADELLINHLESSENKPQGSLAIYNDRFGYLACHLSGFNPEVILHSSTQRQAIHENAKQNSLDEPKCIELTKSLDSPVNYALIKAPKSAELLMHFLDHLHSNSSEEVEVVIGFMTRHFSSSILKVAEGYYEELNQSKAKKKARLLILKKKKSLPKVDLIKSLDYEGKSFKQYLGTFSGNRIDYATAFLNDHLELKPNQTKLLDLGSGNGVIGDKLLELNPEAEIHLLDDSLLAHESGKLNLEGENIHHHWQHGLASFEDESMDLIVSNPPFHFEFEINRNISLNLFKESLRVLRSGGELWLVFNNHLAYARQLKTWFKEVDLIAENKKFQIIKCTKP